MFKRCLDFLTFYLILNFEVDTPLNTNILSKFCQINVSDEATHWIEQNVSIINGSLNLKLSVCHENNQFTKNAVIFLLKLWVSVQNVQFPVVVFARNIAVAMLLAGSWYKFPINTVSRH